MLRNAWLIPLIPAVSFWLILFFGKRLPKGGSEIGVTALAIAFALSCVCVVQWIGRPTDVKPEPAAAHATADAEHGGAEAEPAEKDVHVEESGVTTGEEGEEHAEHAVRAHAARRLLRLRHPRRRGRG